MRRGFIFVLSLIVFLSSLSIRSVFAGIWAVPCTVSYSVSSNHVTYVGSSRSFDVNFTLQGQLNYSCSVVGILPPNATCTWGVTSKSASLEYSCDIWDNHTNPTVHTVGSGMFVLTHGELLNPTPKNIVVDSYNNMEMTVIIHGRLIGDISLDHGSANPSQLEWSTWGTNETVVSANVDTVNVNMSTTYRTYFTVNASIGAWQSPAVDSDITQAAGSPYVDTVIPESLSLLILPLLFTATAVATIVYKKETARFRAQ